MTFGKITQTLRSCFVVLIAVSAISFPSTSQADELVRLAQNLCDAAKSDDRTGMRKKLKSMKIRLRQVYSGIQCGSTGSLLRVATKSGAMQAATFIVTKMKEEALNTPGADGKNIVQWTEGLVSSGDASKQAFVDFYNSKI